MCWKTNENIFLQPIKTKGDIPVFKICRHISNRNYIISAHQNFSYNLNKVYTLEGPDMTLVLPTVNWTTTIASIYEGFHSYITDCKLYDNLVGHIYVMGINAERIGCYDKSHIVKVFGYIPKGSIYYINEKGECVSNSICLTEIKKL